MRNLFALFLATTKYLLWKPWNMSPQVGITNMDMLSCVRKHESAILDCCCTRFIARGFTRFTFYILRPLLVQFRGFRRPGIEDNRQLENT